MLPISCPVKIGRGAGDWDTVYTMYHQLPIVKGVKQTTLLINQPMGKGHLCNCKLGNLLTLGARPHRRAGFFSFLDKLDKLKCRWFGTA